MASPKVSVIIPNYNYSQYVREAIDSVLAQTHSNLEIIVVDDGSTDDSRGVLESYGEQIRVIYQENQGVSATRNNGVKVSGGEFIAFLDADDIWFPSKIEKQMALFEADPEIGMVHTGVVLFDDAGNSLLERTDGMEGWVSDELLRLVRTVILGGGSGIIVSRTAFMEAGGFDRMLSTSADWDFFYRISSRFKVGFVTEVLLKYRVHGSNMHGNINAMERDMMLIYERAFAQGAMANRRECYGNLHKMLAGSYLTAGNYADFVRHSLKSVWKSPSNLGYFLRFPLRRLGKTS